MTLATPVWAVSIAVDVDPSTPGIQSSNLFPVFVNDTVTVDIVASDIVPGAPLNAFEFDLDFGAAVLTATNVGDGGFLLAPVLGIENDVVAPDVNFAEATLLPTGAVGTGVLASVTFNAVGVGVSQLELNEVIFSAPFGVPIHIDAINDGSLTVTQDGGPPIPEPGTILLFGTGLAGLTAWRLKKSQVR